YSTKASIKPEHRPGDVGKFVVDLVVGGVSAALSKTVVAPVERVKLLLQVQYSHKSIGVQNRYKGIVDAFIRVPSEQGFLSFWRGNFTNVMRYFPTQALNFAFNDLYKSVLLKDVSYTSGGCAGSTTLCFVYPLDFIRTRLSVDVGTHKANRDYLGFVDCLKQTVQSDGVKGLYRGFFISIQTYFIYRAVYFGMYDTIRQSIEKDKKNLHFVSSFVIAQVVSIFSAYLTYPWDTVRRRMMIKGTLSTGKAFTAAKRILAEEGIPGLFKGGLANILRLAVKHLKALFYKTQKHLLAFY
ncbi:unnamed protein product, partial [Angiostrongylus costaricensis]|uniref:ADP/ATP translocase n=1 Tax=Angiostrongylus costaricensis TaxID=334426 RepID=A0A0R3PFU4_ANGCS